MKHLKTYESIDPFDPEKSELMVSETDFINTRYWKLIKEDQRIIYWKIEKISANEFILTIENNGRLKDITLDLSNLKFILKKSDVEYTYLVPLSNKEIKDFETKITMSNYNL
jgi:hypothetical protein